MLHFQVSVCFAIRLSNVIPDLIMVINTKEFIPDLIMVINSKEFIEIVRYLYSKPISIKSIVHPLLSDDLLFKLFLEPH